MTNRVGNRDFNLLCQSGFGGFAKLPQFPYGDILHGYMGLSGLTLMGLDAKDFAKKVVAHTACTIDSDDVKESATTDS